MGTCTIVEAGLFLFLSWQLPVGTMDRPGPGLMPRLAAVGLVVSAVLALFERVHAAAEVDALPDRSGALRQLAVMLAMAAYVAAIPFLGFLLSSVVAMSVVARVLDHEGGIRRPVITGVVQAAGIDASFRLLLSLNLPSGFWDIRLA